MTARTTYIFDVRDPGEYAAGHFPEAISAPGGQLVQATDFYAGTLGARIVLSDDKEVRALMTASWLRQMGWKDVFVLPEAGNETESGRKKRPRHASNGPRGRPSAVIAIDDVTLSICRGARNIGAAIFLAPGSPSAAARSRLAEDRPQRRRDPYL